MARRGSGCFHAGEAGGPASGRAAGTVAHKLKTDLERAPKQGRGLPEVTWEDIDQPGAYIELATGDLYRIPPEGLVSGRSPVISRLSLDAPMFVRLSGDPYVGTVRARRMAAEHNIAPNF